MRLPCVDTIHDPAAAEVFEARRAQTGLEPPDVLKSLYHRPEIWGRPFSATLDLAMRGESDWTPGERELFAAYTSSLNQCPF